MRCTRCDRLAIPQAVGRTPDGLLVFGWCVACLRETGCTEIEPAPARSRSADLSRRSPATARPAPESARRIVEARAPVQVLVMVALIVWSGVLCLSGLLAPGDDRLAQRSQFGNGTRALLLGGGAATGTIGLALLATLYGRRLLRSERFLRGLRWGAVGGSVGLLSWGILARNRRTAPAFALLAVATLALSWVARRRERALAAPANASEPREL